MSFWYALRRRDDVDGVCTTGGATGGVGAPYGVKGMLYALVMSKLSVSLVFCE